MLTYGIHFIRLMMPFYLAISFNQIFANALRGAGNSVTPMVIMMGSFIVFRQIYLYFISKYFNNITATALGYPLGWVLCSILLIIYYWKVGLNVKRRSKTWLPPPDASPHLPLHMYSVSALE